MERVICIVIGYVFGLFQTGYIYGKLNHVDIREFGSGNAGTTNAMRVLGKKAGIITYIGDTFKAVFAGLLIRFLFKDSSTDILFLLLMYTGMGVVLGHNFPFYMGFKGGKGIAASSGVILALFDIRLILLALVTFTLVTVITKYVSFGSICMMAGFFIELILFGQTKLLSDFGMIQDMAFSHRIEAYVIGFCFSGLAILKHRANIVRLLSGTERKIGDKKRSEKVDG